MMQTSRHLFSALPAFLPTNRKAGAKEPLPSQRFRPGVEATKKKYLPIIFAGVVALLSSGCASNGSDKQTIGAITGAVIGGVIGNQIGSGSGRTFATGAGVLLGALAGSRIGSYLEEQDRMKQAKATAEALDNAERNEVAWQNPDSGVKGTVEAEPVVVDRQANLQCRVVKQKVRLSDGQTMDEDLKFCRGPGDDWELST
ncbi:glycine zipper 2TM domain-containing protein [Sedimenticola selenatireducens]|nr:glycine zipper 2TM domain-containing protein [Sedimenticola selenatireducens]